MASAPARPVGCVVTLSKFDQMGRDLERIDSLHSCDPHEWTARAVGGDPTTLAGGTSVWGCPTCLPMKLEAIVRVYPDARTEAKASK